jgi:hypothetical protein
VVVLHFLVDKVKVVSGVSGKKGCRLARCHISNSVDNLSLAGSEMIPALKLSQSR